MKRVCFLSMDDLSGYVADDELAIPPLAERGWRVDTVSWRGTDTDWNVFAAVIIRTTWDYQKEPERFLAVLEQIDRSAARLENPLETVRWNLSKTYLRDMEQRGSPIVPTIWDAAYTAESFAAWRRELAADELIMKPVVSATAEHTYRLREYDASLESVFKMRKFMVQPFMPAIVTEGEFSLFYFGGEFSHAINKSPRSNDFRVQEEHGGIITAIRPEPSMLRTADKAVKAIGQELLYARVDLVRDADDNFLLMELELIEPALYFRMDERSPRFFAEQYDRRMRRGPE